jgi:methyl-accepting chemotaxis protein
MGTVWGKWGRMQGLVSEVAAHAGQLGMEICDVAGHIEDVAALVKRQSLVFGGLRDAAAETMRGNRDIAKAAREAKGVAERARAEVDGSRSTVEVSIAEIRDLLEGVTAIEREITGLREALMHVTGVSGDIARIARQSHLLAINAAIEAARAGTAGRGFAIVAAEVKTLADMTTNATRQIEDTMVRLNGRAEHVVAESTANMRRAERVRDGTQVIGAVIGTAGRAMSAFDAEVRRIAAGTDSIESQCAELVEKADELAGGVRESSENFDQARLRIGRLLTSSEEVIQLIAATGVESADTRFIATVQRTAARIAEEFEDAIRRGDISEPDLFDRNYVPVPGTQPQQLLSKCLPLTDRLLPPIQEPLLEFDPKVVFCAAVHENGYLPTHNLKFSKPQGPDPVWNAANCRNRRIFDDRTGAGAGRNTRDFLLQTYRRDMGGGVFALMKDASAPIFVRGRHWGGFRMGYRV